MLLMSPGEPTSNRKLMWFAVALLVYAAVLMLPRPAGLTASGQVALGLLALVIILWISEAVSPAASAIVLTGMAVLGLMGKPLTEDGRAMSSADALGVMLTGFSSSAVLLVAGALFLAVALKLTGLDRRVALLVMSRVGISPARLTLGAAASPSWPASWTIPTACQGMSASSSPGRRDWSDMTTALCPRPGSQRRAPRVSRAGGRSA
jgi:di/tricarboxylate transporter